MTLFEAFLLLTLSFLSFRLAHLRYRRSVSTARGIQANKKKGFIATEWYCQCGDDNCVDKNVSADELKHRYYSFCDTKRTILYNELTYLFFFICISALSIISLIHLYINTIAQ